MRTEWNNIDEIENMWLQQLYLLITRDRLIKYGALQQVVYQVRSANNRSKYFLLSILQSAICVGTFIWELIFLKNMDSDKTKPF